MRFCCVVISTGIVVISPSGDVVALRGGTDGGEVLVLFIGANGSPLLLNAAVISSSEGVASDDTLLLTQ